MKEIELYNCPHCQTKGVLPMDGTRCPNCKQKMGIENRQIPIASDTTLQHIDVPNQPFPKSTTDSISAEQSRLKTADTVVDHIELEILQAKTELNNVKEGQMQNIYDIHNNEPERVNEDTITKMLAFATNALRNKRRIWITPDIPLKRLTKAIAAFAPLNADERPLILIGSSFLFVTSSTLGILFTDKRLYFRHSYIREPQAINYSDMRKVVMVEENDKEWDKEWGREIFIQFNDSIKLEGLMEDLDVFRTIISILAIAKPDLTIEMPQNEVSVQEEVTLFGHEFFRTAIQNAYWGAIIGGGSILGIWLFIFAVERWTGSTYREALNGPSNAPPVYTTRIVEIGIICLICGTVIGFFTTHPKEYVRICPRLLMGVLAGVFCFAVVYVLTLSGLLPVFGFGPVSSGAYCGIFTSIFTLLGQFEKKPLKELVSDFIRKKILGNKW
ncbi:MAG: hypothetical protein ABII09_07085 [Planctomycetota bacterium]